MAIVVIEVKEEIDTQVEEFEVEEGFVAGQIVAAGTYEDLETHRLIYMPHAGILPASCDGHVAVYAQKPPSWGEVVAERRSRQDKNVLDLGNTRPKLHFSEAPQPVLSSLKKNVRASAKNKLLAA